MTNQELAAKIAREIFQCGSDGRDKPRRIQFKGGPDMDHETDLGGLGEQPLTNLILRVLDCFPRPQLPGVPDGYDAVRFGIPDIGDLLVTADDNSIIRCSAKWQKGPRLIVRPIVPPEPPAPPEPHCVWPHGVFLEGRIAQDADNALYWYRTDPFFDDGLDEWRTKSGHFTELLMREGAIKFASHLPYSERIQQVGPTFEATLKRDGDGIVKEIAACGIEHTAQGRYHCVQVPLELWNVIQQEAGKP